MKTLEMKTRSLSRWSLRSLGIDRVCMKPDTSTALMMPLTLYIPQLVEIDGPFVKMQKVSENIWKVAIWLH
jgi:hypothetical protein